MTAVKIDLFPLSAPVPAMGLNLLALGLSTRSGDKLSQLWGPAQKSCGTCMENTMDSAQECCGPCAGILVRPTAQMKIADISDLRSQSSDPGSHNLDPSCSDPSSQVSDSTVQTSKSHISDLRSQSSDRSSLNPELSSQSPDPSSQTSDPSSQIQI